MYGEGGNGRLSEAQAEYAIDALAGLQLYNHLSLLPTVNLPVSLPLPSGPQLPVIITSGGASTTPLGPLPAASFPLSNQPPSPPPFALPPQIKSPSEGPSRRPSHQSPRSGVQASASRAQQHRRAPRQRRGRQHFRPPQHLIPQDSLPFAPFRPLSTPLRSRSKSRSMRTTRSPRRRPRRPEREERLLAFGSCFLTPRRTSSRREISRSRTLRSGRSGRSGLRETRTNRRAARPVRASLVSGRARRGEEEGMST